MEAGEAEAEAAPRAAAVSAPTSCASASSAPRLPRALTTAIAGAAQRRRLAGLAAAKGATASELAVQHDDLLCSICFDILCFPVTLSCGHNFDRGCILTAWEYDTWLSGNSGALQRGQAPPSPRRPAPEEDPAEDQPPAPELDAADIEGRAAPNFEGCRHLCPLCRQQAGVRTVDELQVNLLLKDLITSLYPAETRGVATPAKQQRPHTLATHSNANGARALATSTAATAFRRRPSLRTFSSFVYVCVASVTDPPGFVLAVLLLLALVATACSPQSAAAPPAASAMLLFDTMDRVCNALALLIHHVSQHLDQMDTLTPAIRLFSFIV